MELKLACADFTFPLLSHEAAIRLVGMAGMHGVDIGLFTDRTHLQPHDVLADLKGTASNLSAMVRDAGVEFADIFIQPGKSFDDLAVNHPDAGVRREARDQFSRLLDFTVLCKAPHMTQLPGIIWEGETEADSIKRCSDELAWRVDECRKVGVEFAIEPHIGSVVPTPESAGKLVSMTPGLTLTLDYTHFTAMGMPDERIEPLLPYASHFHCRGGRTDRLQAPFKENTIDYKRVLSGMKKNGYHGFVGIEYVWIDWQHCNEVDNISETILFRDYLKEAFRSID